LIQDRISLSQDEKYEGEVSIEEDDPVTNELLLLAQSLHAKLTFPWYSHVSPDGQSHQQVATVNLVAMENLADISFSTSSSAKFAKFNFPSFYSGSMGEKQFLPLKLKLGLKHIKLSPTH